MIFPNKISWAQRNQRNIIGDSITFLTYQNRNEQNKNVCGHNQQQNQYQHNLVSRWRENSGGGGGNVCVETAVHRRGDAANHARDSAVCSLWQPVTNHTTIQ